jgi:hypothetical protein
MSSGRSAKVVGLSFEERLDANDGRLHPIGWNSFSQERKSAAHSCPARSFIPFGQLHAQQGTLVPGDAAGAQGRLEQAETGIRLHL